MTHFWKAAFYRTLAGLTATICSAALAQPQCADPRQTARQSALHDLDAGLIAIDADRVDLRADGVSGLFGPVRIQYDDTVLIAHDVEYDNAAGRLHTRSDTLFETSTIGVTAAGADISASGRSASFEGAEFFLFENGAHGIAGEIALDSAGIATLGDVSYSTCPASSRDWVLAGERITLNPSRGMGSARNISLRFKGVPLFWTPVFYFPVGDQRQTGFLPPQIGNSSSTGADVQIPFYLNLAPNYDATLTPRFMSNRGAQMRTRLRGLWRSGHATADLEYMPRDEALGDARSAAFVDAAGGGGHWTWMLGYRGVSDTDYLIDLGGSQSSAAASELLRYGWLGYRHPAGLRGEVLVQGFQPLLPNLPATQSPYTRLPDLTLAWQPAYRSGHLRPGLAINSVNFTHDERISGWRTDLTARLDWRYDFRAAFTWAAAQWRHTRYDLENSDGLGEQYTRDVPLTTAGGGLRFVRTARSGLRQTLVPQISYLYIPRRDQDALPVFDTAIPDFSYDRLTAENRYTSIDRIADANLVTPAIASQWLDPATGERRLGFKLGFQWRLDPSIVTLADEESLGSGSSDWLGELDVNLSDDWRALVGGQWNASANTIEQAVAALRYSPREDAYLQTGWRFRRDNFEQVDTYGAWPISPRWRVAGRWTFSLDANRTLETLAGFEYQSCCWAGRLAWRRYLNGAAEDFDSSIYLQLELKGLAKLGEGIDELLDRDILSP